MSRFWSSSRADGGLSFAYHLFSSLSTQSGFFCSSPLRLLQKFREEGRRSGAKRRSSLLHNQPQTSLLLLLFLLKFDQMKKDVKSAALPGLASSSLPNVAVPPPLHQNLLHRHLITVDKHAGGDLHPHQLRLEGYATSRKFWLRFSLSSCPRFTDKAIKRKNC